MTGLPRRGRVLAVALVVIVLAACTQPSATSSEKPNGSSTPTIGGILTYAVSTYLTPLDMIRSTTPGDYTVGGAVYDTLYLAQPLGRVEPGLAEKTSISQDGLTWTLTLRAGVKFHDGTDFDATAVKWNLDTRRTTTTFPLKAQLALIKEARVVDSKTIQLLLNQPVPALMVVLSSPAFGMQSPAAWSQYSDPAQYTNHAAGTGPFKLDGTPSSANLTLVRNDQYWGPKPYLDKIVFRLIADDSARIAALEAGDVNMIDQVPGNEYQRLTQDGKVTTILTPAAEANTYLWFNLSKAPFSDKRVRQAIIDGLHLDQYPSITSGLGSVADSIVPPALAGYSKSVPYPYDLAKAKQLLSDAGVSSGSPVEIITYASPSFYTVQLAQLVKQDLDALGFSTTIRSGLDVNGWFSIVGTSAVDSKWQLTISAAGYPYLDAEAVLLRQFPSAVEAPKGNNWEHYKNDQVDALLAQQAQTTDPAARNKLLAQVQQILWDDVPIYPLVALRRAFATSKSVHDVDIIAAAANVLRFSRTWISK
jgi:peptide/nickel transport system substrate-binding protein